MADNPVKRTGPGAAGLLASLQQLTALELLVGFPQDTTQRNEDSVGTQGMTNAALGYIHDHGAPEANIPARPFMAPGVEAVKEQAAEVLEGIIDDVRAGVPDAVNRGYHQLGLTVQASIRGVINDGIDPPLAEATLRARAARGRVGAQQELENRAAGLPAGTALAKPLIDTGQLRNAVNYVIRPRDKRS